MSELNCALLVYDQSGTVWIPPQLGTPRHDQLIGTPLEQLSELSGRGCYDSLGKGRPSQSKAELIDGKEVFTEGYHDHIRAVGHGSVLEHAALTVAINQTADIYPFLMCLVNRRGLWVWHEKHTKDIRVTFNLRHIRDWNNFRVPRSFEKDNRELYAALARIAHANAPQIVTKEDIGDVPPETPDRVALVQPEHEEEMFMSMYLSGSRGFSHEMVRHRNPVSQRSTRYVDESESDWVKHPLILKFWTENAVNSQGDGMADLIGNAEKAGRETYTRLVDILQSYLIARGADKQTARKQARGAARGYLGNALFTEMIFTASVFDWKHMLGLRAAAPADAEIRLVFEHVLTELKRSQYGQHFKDYRQELAPDGIGKIAARIN